MRNVKRTGWVLIGAVIGGLATNSVSAVKLQVRSDAVDPSRLTVALASTSMGTVGFVKDTKSSGCWIVFTGQSAVSIATAPAEACR
jgi:hypothetical protein